MARLQAAPPEKWTAEIKAEVTNLSISAMSKESKRGNQKQKVITVPSIVDGVYYFDVGERSKAMILQQLRMLKSESFADGIKIGVWSESLPTPGRVPLVKISDICGEDELNPMMKDEVVPLDGLNYPYIFVVPSKSGGSSNFGYRYLVEGPIDINFRVRSVARRFTPETLEEILESSIWHIGDHNTRGFGTGKLKKFTVTEKPTKFQTL